MDSVYVGGREAAHVNANLWPSGVAWRLAGRRAIVCVRLAACAMPGNLAARIQFETPRGGLAPTLPQNTSSAPRKRHCGNS